MKTKSTAVWPVLMGIAGLGLAGFLFAAEPPASPAIGETFACTYKDGKGFEDKMKARDYMVAQMDKAGLKKVPAYHMTQTRGMAPVDTLWMDVHPTLEAYGANSDAWDASGIGPGVDARFAAVEDCTSGLSALRIIHQQEGSDDDSDGKSLVVTLACELLEGRGAQQIDDLTAHMGSVMKGMGADAPNFAYLRNPITSGRDFPDLFLSSVFSDTSHWTRYVGQLFGTDAGGRMRNHMGMVVDCNISMWKSQQVVAGDDE